MINRDFYQVSSKKRKKKKEKNFTQMPWVKACYEFIIFFYMMTFSTNAWWPLNDMQSHLTDVMGEKNTNETRFK